MVAPSIEQLVRQRARHRCEYCRIPEAYVIRRFHLDHIVAKQHISDDSLENLALSCHRCNNFKGPNLSGIDPATRTLIPLFNPRTQRWEDHFKWEGARILGVTDIGRVTIHVLNMNEAGALKMRGALMRRQLFF